MKNENSTATCAPDYESMYEELQKRFECLKAENNEIYKRMMEMETELKEKKDVNRSLAEHNAFLEGQIEAYKYCIDNRR